MLSPRQYGEHVVTLLTDRRYATGVAYGFKGRYRHHRAGRLIQRMNRAGCPGGSMEVIAREVSDVVF